MKQLLAALLILVIVYQPAFAQDTSDTKDSEIIIQEAANKMTGEEVYDALNEAIDNAVASGAAKWVEGPLLQIDDNLIDGLDTFVAENVSSYSERSKGQITAVIISLVTAVGLTAGAIVLLRMLTAIGSVPPSMAVRPLITARYCAYGLIGFAVVLVGTAITILFASFKDPYEDRIENPELMFPQACDETYKARAREYSVRDLNRNPEFKEAIFKYILLLELVTVRRNIEKGE